MCCGHRAYHKALLGAEVLHLEDATPLFLEQSEHFKPKLRLTVQSHMLSDGNDRAWPGRQEGLFRFHCWGEGDQI